MDFYLTNSNVTQRLIKEWKEHGKLIIAYDFDNTVYDYHNEGHTFHNVINLLERCKKVGAKFIVFTSCSSDKFDFINRYLQENGIPYDAINENVEGIPFEGRKVYYNILLDDRAGLRSAYESLLEAVEYMEGEQNDT